MKFTSGMSTYWHKISNNGHLAALAFRSTGTSISHSIPGIGFPSRAEDKVRNWLQSKLIFFGPKTGRRPLKSIFDLFHPFGWIYYIALANALLYLPPLASFNSLVHLCSWWLFDEAPGRSNRKIVLALCGWRQDKDFNLLSNVFINSNSESNQKHYVLAMECRWVANETNVAAQSRKTKKEWSKHVV